METEERPPASLGTWIKRILIGAAILAALSRAINGSPTENAAKQLVATRATQTASALASGR